SSGCSAGSRLRSGRARDDAHEKPAHQLMARNRGRDVPAGRRLAMKPAHELAPQIAAEPASVLLRKWSLVVRVGEFVLDEERDAGKTHLQTDERLPRWSCEVVLICPRVVALRELDFGVREQHAGAEAGIGT